VRIANPQWAQTEQLVDARDLALTVEVWPLLRGRLVLDRLAVRKASVGLERADGRATWRFAPQGDPAQSGRAPAFEVQEVHANEALIRYRHDAEDTALDIEVRGTAGGPGGGTVKMQASGRYRGERAEAHATAPSLLLSADQAIDLRFEAAIGATRAQAEGKFQASTRGVQSIHASFKLSGPSFAALNNILRIDMPGTPPYDLTGRLVHEGPAWKFEDFAGRVGDSDLRGTWSYHPAGTRPLVRADLRSNVLDVDDLGPLVGAPPATGKGETASPAQKRKAERMKQAGKALPSTSLGAERWRAVDADVRYEAERILHGPVSSLRTHAVLENGRLRLSPLVAGVAGGRLEGSALLDAQADPLHANVDVELRSLELARLFPDVRSSEPAMGKLYGRFNLEGRGGSIGALLARSNGGVQFIVEGGSVNALLVEAVGLDAGEAVLLLGSKGKERVPLNCAVMDFAVDSGTAQVQTFVVDTRDTLITITGSVDLAKERLDLLARPQPRDVSAPVARTPLAIGGSFRAPTVRPKGGPLAARVAAAGLLALVNPLLALIPLIESGTAPDSNCAQLLGEAKAAK
jgi:hypothetical protein